MTLMTNDLNDTQEQILYGIFHLEAVNVKRMGAKVKSRSTSDISGHKRTAICGTDVFLQRVRERIMARNENTRINNEKRGQTERNYATDRTS